MGHTIVSTSCVVVYPPELFISRTHLPPAPGRSLGGRWRYLGTFHGLHPKSMGGPHRTLFDLLLRLQEDGFGKFLARRLCHSLDFVKVFEARSPQATMEVIPCELRSYLKWGEEDWLSCLTQNGQSLKTCIRNEGVFYPKCILQSSHSHCLRFNSKTLGRPAGSLVFLYLVRLHKRRPSFLNLSYPQAPPTPTQFQEPLLGNCLVGGYKFYSPRDWSSLSEPSPEKGCSNILARFKCSSGPIALSGISCTRFPYVGLPTRVNCGLPIRIRPQHCLVCPPKAFWVVGISPSPSADGNSSIWLNSLRVPTLLTRLGGGGGSSPKAFARAQLNGAFGPLKISTKVKSSVGVPFVNRFCVFLTEAGGVLPLVSRGEGYNFPPVHFWLPTQVGQSSSLTTPLVVAHTRLNSASNSGTLWIKTCLFLLLQGENIHAWYFVQKTPGFSWSSFQEGSCLAMDPSGCSKPNSLPLPCLSKQSRAAMSAISVSSWSLFLDLVDMFLRALGIPSRVWFHCGPVSVHS